MRDHDPFQDPGHPALQIFNAAPDGITSDEWRRAVALLAVAQLSTARGDCSTNKHACRMAGRIAEWIKTGEYPNV